MSLLNTQPRVGVNDPLLQKELSDHANLVNLMANGKLAGTNYTAAAVPTAGTHALGDFIRNSAPAEAGSAGSKYVVIGWIVTVGGTPGTLLPCRVLTGN